MLSLQHVGQGTIGEIPQKLEKQPLVSFFLRMQDNHVSCCQASPQTVCASQRSKYSCCSFHCLITVPQQNTQPLFELSVWDEWELNTLSRSLCCLKLFYVTNQLLKSFCLLPGLSAHICIFSMSHMISHCCSVTVFGIRLKSFLSVVCTRISLLINLIIHQDMMQ